MDLPRCRVLLARVPEVECRTVLLAVTHRRFRDLGLLIRIALRKAVAKSCGRLISTGPVR
jgi:hypothetical protein